MSNRGPLGYYNDLNKQLSATAKSYATPTVLALLQVLLISYAGLFAPALPKEVSNWTAHPASKVVILALILWTANKDPGVSLAIAMSFLTILHLVGAKDQSLVIVEGFEGPKTAIIPGCLNFTLYDLLESFGDDTDKLYQAMVIAKVPGNVQLSDDNAGLIATFLINAGYTLRPGACIAPQ